MKHLRVAMIVLLTAVVAVATFQVTRPAASLAGFMPEGALLYIEAKDFGTILRDWNSSQEKQSWLKSDSLSMFSRSRLYGRLHDVQEQFGEAAGLNPDMNLLGDSSGTETAFAWYDIGKMEFLFVSRQPSAKSMQSALWQMRGKFESRKVGDVDFYVRTNPKTQRTAAFAVVGDYLVIGTKEDLVAGAVELISGKKQRTLRDEEWFANAVAAAKEPGDLRMVMNLTEIVPSGYFRTYWVQQNITNLKQYSAAVSDLYRGTTEYREERVLIRDGENPDSWTTATPEDSKSVAEIAKVVPENIGFFKAVAGPRSGEVLDLVVTKVLAPHLGAAPIEKLAPKVSLTNGQTGSESDLETRIDEAPIERNTNESSTAALAELFDKNPASSMLILHSTDKTPDDGFVNIRSCVVIRGKADWNVAAAREAVKAAVRPGLTASELGVVWKQEGGNAVDVLDGLSTISMAAQGKWLVISNNPQDVVAVLRRTKAPVSEAAESYVAGFQHQQERSNYLQFVRFVDHKTDNGQTEESSEPQFFSGNIASVSEMFKALRSEKIVEKDEGEKVFQTVTYEWSH